MTGGILGKGDSPHLPERPEGGHRLRSVGRRTNGDCPLFPAACHLNESAVRTSLGDGRISRRGASIAIGASLLGIAIARPTALSILAISAVLAWLAWRAARQQASGLCTSGLADHEVDSAGFSPWTILAVAALAYVVMLAYSIAGHDFTCDGNAYHIPTINAYLTHQRVGWIEEPFLVAQYMNGYPKGAELFAMILVQGLHPALLNTANVLFLPLGSLGIAYLARSLGASSSLALLAGAAWLLLPVNVCQAGTTYVDSSYASCAAAFLAILLSIVRGAENLANVKRAGTLVAGGRLGLRVWVGHRNEALGDSPRRARNCSRNAGSGRSQWPPTGVCDGAGKCWSSPVFSVLSWRSGRLLAATGSIRNWVMEGSPLYPVGLVVAGHRLFPGPTVAEAIDTNANTPQELRHLPAWKATLLAWLQIGSPGRRWPRAIVGVDSQLGGLGYLWLVGCVPAIAWVMVRAVIFKRSDLAAVVCLIAVAAAAFVLQPLCWWARFTVWIYAVGLPCFAVAAHHGLRGTGHPGGKRGTRTVALAFLPRPHQHAPRSQSPFSRRFRTVVSGPFAFGSAVAAPFC